MSDTPRCPVHGRWMKIDQTYYDAEPSPWGGETRTRVVVFACPDFAECGETAEQAERI